MQASIPSIMLAPYPTAQQGWSQPELDSQYEQAQAVVAAIRKLRSDYGLTRQRPTVYVACSSAARAEVIQGLAGDIACLSTSAEVLLLAADAPVPPYSSVAIVDDVVTVHMVLKVRVCTLQLQPIVVTNDLGRLGWLQTVMMLNFQAALC
jgi:valyl-tRNA synthetase